MHTSTLACLVLLAAACARAQDDNYLCPCDTEDTIKENKLLRQFLGKVPETLTDEEKQLYAIYPGILYQLDCSRCEEEKHRSKRKILPDIPVREKDYDDLGEKRKLKSGGCAAGYVRIAHMCVDSKDIDY